MQDNWSVLGTVLPGQPTQSDLLESQYLLSVQIHLDWSEVDKVGQGHLVQTPFFKKYIALHTHVVPVYI